MSKIKITFEFDSYEDSNELFRMIHRENAYSALWDIDQAIRNKLKHCNDNWLNDEKACNYLEYIREVIYESGALRYDE